MNLAIVGTFGGTHLGSSLSIAAEALEIAPVCFDTSQADSGGRLAKALRWRFADRRPAKLAAFGGEVARRCAAEDVDVLIAAGPAALDASAIQALRRAGVRCLNFASDDPWNPRLSADWQLRALPHYDLIFTPRRANLEDFRRLGCQRVEYLPFGYDDALFGPSAANAGAPIHDVLFVGGADRDRAAFMSDFMADGPAVALAGGYWRRYPATRAHALGLKSPAEVNALTAAAKVNLCLVRRANRDGHVMRSLEIAAIGGAMLAEDTDEHRALFGEDGESVVYFRDPRDAAERAERLIGDTAGRARLAAALRARMEGAGHAYKDRLRRMLEIAGDRR
jgi:hypothetical protein